MESEIILIEVYMETKSLKIGDSLMQVKINPDNTQMFSIVSLEHGGVEVMWQGGAPVPPAGGWPNSEIQMFPITGPAKDNRILVNCVYYNMSQHGFLRDLPWKLVRRDTDTSKVTFEAKYNAMDEVLSKKGIKSVYPGSFKFTKTYEVADGELIFTLKIKNNSDEDKPFAAGWHPAFVASKEGSVEILYNKEQKACVTLPQVRESVGNVIKVSQSDLIVYRNPDFTLELRHNLGQNWIWDRAKAT